MLKQKLVLLAMAAAVASCNAQEGAVELNIKKQVELRLIGGLKIDSVKLTPYSGLYEIRAGGVILYADKTGTYLFEGDIINTKTQINVTNERREELAKIKFSDLPLDSALKMVKGNGKRVIAIFEDPNCGYCKRFRATTLKEVDNITVYTFMYNILSQDSVNKSKAIWCSADRNKAWDDWMIGGKLPAPAPANCDTPNEKIFALGRQMNIQGTPAIYFADGSRIAGAIDAKGLEAKLATIKQ
jgi:thiol:disulfide interchange protein DsbC